MPVPVPSLFWLNRESKQSRPPRPAPGREWSREHRGGCQHGLGRQEAPGRVITMWKDRRSRKSQCAVQRAELGPGRLRAWRPGHARGCPGRLWERPRAHVPSRQLSSPPLHRKVKGEPGTCSSGETEVQALGLCRGRLDVGRLDHAALPRVRIRGARLSRT